MTKLELEQKKHRIREYAKAFIAGNQTDEEYAKDLRDEAIEFASHLTNILILIRLRNLEARVAELTLSREAPKKFTEESEND
jgi:hypothetical protein